MRLRKQAPQTVKQIRELHSRVTKNSTWLAKGHFTHQNNIPCLGLLLIFKNSPVQQALGIKVFSSFERRPYILILKLTVWMACIFKVLQDPHMEVSVEKCQITRFITLSIAHLLFQRTCSKTCQQWRLLLKLALFLKLGLFVMHSYCRISIKDRLTLLTIDLRQDPSGRGQGGNSSLSAKIFLTSLCK